MPDTAHVYYIEIQEMLLHLFVTLLKKLYNMAMIGHTNQWE